MRLLLLFLVFVSSACSSFSQGLRIHVHLDTSIKKSLTGRLYIFSQPDTAKGVQDPDPFNPSPTFYKDVLGWNNAQTQVLDAGDAGYPVTLKDIKPGWYKFAAIVDVNTEERSFSAAPGNCYSRKDVLAEVRRDSANEVHLRVNAVFGERKFRETETARNLSLKSDMLSRFHKKDIFIKAAVVLPPSYKTDSSKKYPVVFIIPGWGGTHYDVLNKFTADRYGIGRGKEKIYVCLNPETQTPWGLHAFVDSRVNGPWGKALVEELKPWLMKNYRVLPDPSQHFLAGQSSGGYGVLWLQLHYPGAFGACWAVSPDPVDFSNFTSVNLYQKGVNVYYDMEGRERPFFIWQGKPVSTLKRFMEFEHFMGDGGQQQSFEAEFGQLGRNGKPQPLFDIKTGAVDPEVVARWKAYDLGLYVQENWNKIKDKAAGKVFVFAGKDDNFFLQQSVEEFRKKAEVIKAGLVAELVPDSDHWSIWKKEFSDRMQSEFDKRISNSN